jgi:hypothetical protein
MDNLSERELIVAWLRSQAEMRDRLAADHPTIEGTNYNRIRAIALHMAYEAIERGDHLNDTPPITKESNDVR